jgi:hypothetical protein
MQIFLELIIRLTPVSSNRSSSKDNKNSENKSIISRKNIKWLNNSSANDDIPLLQI